MAPSTTPPPLPDVVRGSIQEAAPALLALERQGAIDSDLGLLAQLWAPDGAVVDGRNTATADDDLVWQPRWAVLDRYAVAVFPNPPPPWAPLNDVTLTERDEEALLINGIDRWRFRFEDGRWWIVQLAYQQPDGE